MDLWKKIVDFIVEMLGPPDVDNEMALRQYLRRAADLGAAIARIVPGDLDNQIVAALASLVDDDDKWRVLYAIIVRVWGDGKVEVGESVVRAYVSREEEAKLGIPIGLLIQVILFIISILKKR